MAKFKISSGHSKYVSCNILNENARDYIVQFKNGQIDKVHKNLVYDLDKIDEGVLDSIKSIGRGIKNLFFNVVKKGQKLYFYLKNKLLDIVPPVNIMSSATEIEGLGFIPGSQTKSVAKYYGIDVVEVEEGSDTDDIDDTDEGAWCILTPEQFLKQVTNRGVNESFINEDYAEYDGESDDPEHPFIRRRSKENELEYKTTEEIQDILMDMVHSMTDPNFDATKIRSLCLWGAPGIGKTSIIKSFVQMVREFRPTFDIININAGGLKPFDLTYPIARHVNRTITGPDGEPRDITDTVSEDIVKNWIPTYKPLDESVEVNKEWNIMLDDIANGGHYINGDQTPDLDRFNDLDKWIPGDGGIIFIDEFSRIPQATMEVFMSMLSDRVVGTSNAKIGSKWIIVTAANRKSDMTIVGADNMEGKGYDKAKSDRIQSYNYDMTPEEWLNWATRKEYQVPGTNELIPNVSPVITDFLSIREFQKYYYYAQQANVDDKEFVSTKIASATPRRWTDFSNAIRIFEYSNNFFNDSQAFFDSLDSQIKNTNLKPYEQRQLQRAQRQYQQLLKANEKMLSLRGKLSGRETINNEEDIPHGVWNSYAITFLGEKVASAFMSYLEVLDFKEEDAISVWNTGKPTKHYKFNSNLTPMVAGSKILGRILLYIPDKLVQYKNMIERYIAYYDQNPTGDIDSTDNIMTKTAEKEIFYYVSHVIMFIILFVKSCNSANANSSISKLINNFGLQLSDKIGVNILDSHAHQAPLVNKLMDVLMNSSDLNKQEVLKQLNDYQSGYMTESINLYNKNYRKLKHYHRY